MAIYTSYFVTSDADLSRWLPGWKRPLAEPVRVKQMNWFTKQEQEVWSWDPDPDHPSTGEVVMQAYAVVAIDGSYEAYLDARAHPIVRSSPHHCWKGVDVLQMETLRALFADESADYELVRFPPARITPPELNCDITVLPDELTAALAELPSERVETTAEAWMDSGDLGADELTPDEAAKVLRGLVELARVARGAGGFVCLMTEW